MHTWHTHTHTHTGTRQEPRADWARGAHLPPPPGTAGPTAGWEGNRTGTEPRGTEGLVYSGAFLSAMASVWSPRGTGEEVRQGGWSREGACECARPRWVLGSEGIAQTDLGRRSPLDAPGEESQVMKPPWTPQRWGTPTGRAQPWARTSHCCPEAESAVPDPAQSTKPF